MLLCLHLNRRLSEPEIVFYTQGEVTSHNLWLRYDRHFVGIGLTRYNGGEDLVCYSNKITLVGLQRCPYDH